VIKRRIRAPKNCSNAPELYMHI